MDIFVCSFFGLIAITIILFWIGDAVSYLRNKNREQEVARADLDNESLCTMMAMEHQMRKEAESLVNNIDKKLSEGWPKEALENIVNSNNIEPFELACYGSLELLLKLDIGLRISKCSKIIKHAINLKLFNRFGKEF